MKRVILLLFATIIGGHTLYSQKGDLNTMVKERVSELSENLYPLYVDLHKNPELSGFERRTSGIIANQLNELGFNVTENIGGLGVVGMFRNGEGPVIMLRTDMDALPIKENTNLDFASSVTMKDSNGDIVPVMHACGHDMHMTVWLGTLKNLIALKDYWSGTIMAVAQPAEEIGAGAKRMITDGLFTRFPVPDYSLCFHVSADLPTGTVGYNTGSIFAGVNSADITIYGEGGHGAMPHTTIDPIVLAARTVLALQTIVSREINPVVPAVVTVGSIHGGTKHNIIPGEVKMQLTLRFFDDNTYEYLQEALVRITRGIAISAGLPEDKMPVVALADQYHPPVANNPQLVGKSVLSMSSILGEANVVAVDPSTVAEDFGLYGRTEDNIKIALFWLGSVNREIYSESIKSGEQIPALHNEGFCPDFGATFQTGVEAMSRTMIDLFNNE
jgi:hippurate hydrolase